MMSSKSERTARSKHTQTSRAQRRSHVGTPVPIWNPIVQQIVSFLEDGYRCGPKNDKKICPFPLCCSNLGGWCGDSVDHCDLKACDLNYGVCGPQYIPPPGASDAEACGEGHGNCTGDLCCSRANYCGSDEAYCSLTEGCQPQYGKCGYSSGLSPAAVSGIVLGILVLRCSIVALAILFNSKKRKGPLTVYTFRRVSEATNAFSPLNKIGEGAYGVVYKGVVNGKDVAVKKMTLDSEDKEKDFKAEVQFRSAHLNHMNLMEVIGFCVQHQDGYLIYDYVHNNSLSHWLFRSEDDRGEVFTLSWENRLNIAKGVAEALIYLHHKVGGGIRHVVHCDLKPDNILLTSGLVPKLADFGMTKLIMSNEQCAKGNARADKVRGTPGYRPPEKHLGTEADVFSFGIVLLELLSGRRVFAESNGQLSYYLPVLALDCIKSKPENLSILLESELESKLLPTQREEVMTALCVALWCLQIDPKDRPDMKQVRVLLEGYVMVGSQFLNWPRDLPRMKSTLREHGVHEASVQYILRRSY